MSHEEAQSASILLKEHGLGYGAVTFNCKLVALGLLEDNAWRKRLTPTGQRYGVNVPYAKNKALTKQYYYTDMFTELLRVVEGGNP